MKMLSLLAFCFAISTSGFAAEDKPELVRIQTIEGRLVWVTKDVLKDAYLEAFGTPKPKLSAAEKLRAAMQVRQDAYAWAYAQAGANMSPTEARAFSEEISARDNAAEALEVFQDAYAFAYSQRGANLSPTEARKLADRLSRLEDPKALLDVFKQAYTNAYSQSGMNLSPTEALKYALKSIGLK